MGQQQLLLVILVTILVGIATVVALNVFGTAAEDANRDAVRQDLLQGATSAQAIWARPAMLDGAGQDFSRAEISANLIERLGMPIVEDHTACTGNAGSFGNENGCYYIGAEITNDSFEIIGEPSSGGLDIIADISRNAEGDWVISIADEGETVTEDPA